MDFDDGELATVAENVMRKLIEKVPGLSTDRFYVYYKRHLGGTYQYTIIFNKTGITLWWNDIDVHELIDADYDICAFKDMRFHDDDVEKIVAAMSGVGELKLRTKMPSCAMKSKNCAMKSKNYAFDQAVLVMKMPRRISKVCQWPKKNNARDVSFF